MKNLLDLAAKQLKWQHWDWLSISNHTGFPNQSAPRSECFFLL